MNFPAPIDVVWLKRDVRLQDHGPLSAVAQSSNRFVVLYLYEKDQLQHSTVHGSHIQFYNEGLVELDNKFSGVASASGSKTDANVIEPSQRMDQLSAITCCYANCVDTLTALNKIHPIGRLLAHEETGHFASYQRDRRVRRWCKESGVKCIEYHQSGVTRRLKDRDDFSAKLNSFLGKPQYPSVDPSQIRGRLINDVDLPGRCGILHPSDIAEIPEEHKGDREERQRGGEEEALAILHSFLNRRGQCYQKGISSPNSSWSSCSRLSPYLAWGNVSLRRVMQATKQRQAEIKAQRSAGVPLDGDWGRSLGAFLSRMHWRSHFIQKLEMEPLIEKRDMHPAHQHLRRQEGDWNQSYFEAWITGHTGYPFVDACMRCLYRHGWLNFRMRAMVVSFAAWNLWLDWKKIAPHLARLFLDYEPGIHYPQLQMQSGAKLQRRIKTRISSKREDGNDFVYYPKPIVDEKQTAKVAKDKVSAVRKQAETKQMAGQVYQKHGSRNGPNDFRDGKSQPSSSKKQKVGADGQRSIKMFASATGGSNISSTQSHETKSPAKPSPSETICSVEDEEEKKSEVSDEVAAWNCKICTFENDKPLAPVCGMCGSER